MKLLPLIAALAFGSLAGAFAGGTVVIAPDASAADALAAADAVLSRGGRTEWSIAVAPDASPTDVFAAEELKLHLEESTGAVFPIVSNALPKGPAIEVGTAKARELLGADRVRALRSEESVYVQRGGRLAIVGGGRTGNAYGVYSFLERELGCRWFDAAGGKRVPRHPDLSIGPRDVTERPALRVRKILCIGQAQKADSSEHLFYFRNRLNCINGDYGKVCRADLRGKLVPEVVERGVLVHSLFSYLSPTEFFKDHPDWFTYDAKRKVRVDNRQLCFSNAGLRAKLTERLLARMTRYGGKGTYNLSAMDVGGKFCECEACAALADRYGTPGGAQFDYLLELSQAMTRTCPAAKLHFLVYRDEQTRFPPKGVPRFPPNLIAMFAPISADLSKDYLHAHNREMYEDLKRWCSLAETWQWYYPQLYGPTGRAIKPPYGGFARTALDTRLSAEAGMVGGYYEHDVGTKLGFNFADPLTWVIMRLYIDPAADWKSLRKECFGFFYGAAADDMAAFEDFLEAEREKVPWQRWSGCVDAYFSPRKMLELNAAFNRMERKVAGDPEVVQRIREARIGVDFEILRRYRQVAAGASEEGWTLRSVYDRVTNTVVRAAARRIDAPGKWWADYRGKLVSDVLKQVDDEMEQVQCEAKPLPAEFAKVPWTNVIQIFPSSSDANGKNVFRVDMPDAAIGKALYEDAAEERLSVPYSVGIYNADEKRTLLGGSAALSRKDIVPGTFRLYRLGRTTLSSSRCSLWVGYSWRLTVPCSVAFVAGERPEYDVYVSLKFDGPKFGGDASRKSAVYFDRLVFVKVGD